MLNKEEVYNARCALFDHPRGSDKAQLIPFDVYFVISLTLSLEFFSVYSFRCHGFKIAKFSQFDFKLINPSRQNSVRKTRGLSKIKFKCEIFIRFNVNIYSCINQNVQSDKFQNESLSSSKSRLSRLHFNTRHKVQTKK